VPDEAFVFRAEGIGKSFRFKEVLKSASLWAAEGKVTTLMGRNGSGKTTLMRIAAGDLRADRGRVALDGQTIRRPRLARLARRGLMYVPQNHLGAPHFKVRAHLGALRRVFHLEDVREAVDACEIGSLLDQRISALSKGERVRVSLAFAMARRPTVLLIDEPLTGLVPRDQERLGVHLQALARWGTAVVTSGHDVRPLLAISDAVIWSAAGTTHHLGSPEEAVRHHQFRREYLGPGFEA
jgi:lipopolysaccharide export system ATP-binding protein